MEKQIAPKTLVAVLAAQIKEDAEFIAKRIVEASKGSDIDYSFLIDNYIFKKVDESPIKLSQFAENASNEISKIDSSIKKVLTFEISVSYYWSRDKDTLILKPQNTGKFSFKSEIDEKYADRDWNKSIYGSGNNIYQAFEEFKTELKNKINPLAIDTEIIVESETKIKE